MAGFTCCRRWDMRSCPRYAGGRYDYQVANAIERTTSNRGTMATCTAIGDAAVTKLAIRKSCHAAGCTRGRNQHRRHAIGVAQLTGR